MNNQPIYLRLAESPAELPVGASHWWGYPDLPEDIPAPTLTDATDGEDYALTFIDDTETCRDIVSDVFETLWQEYDTIRRDTLTAYLYACVKNRCIDLLRRRSVKERYVTFYSLDLKGGLLNTDAEEQERIARIEKVIEHMPAQRQFVLKECFYHKKTYKEVADILGITTEGIKKHIKTALKNLRDEFLLK